MIFKIATINFRKYIMKTIKSIIFFCLLINLISCASIKTTDKKIDHQLNRLLETKSFFKLRDAITENEAKLSEDRLLYYNVFIANAFGKHEESSKYIDKLLKNYPSTLNDTMHLKLLDIKADNKIYNYKYKEASDIHNEIITQHYKILDSAELANYKNVQSLFGSLASVKPQIVHLNQDVIISATLNEFNHLMTPVKSNGITEKFIFDTGANLSTISESQAEKMNLKIIDQKINVGSATQNNVTSKLAVAENFYVGDIRFENVVFLVMPDDHLSFPQINYTIKGIIGFPVIHQLGEIHLNKNGEIKVPVNRNKNNLRNMFLNSLTPVVRAVSGKDTLLFTFDTGAKSSELSMKYYKQHESIIKAEGKHQVVQRGGAGGLKTINTYVFENFPIEVGTKNLKLPQIHVSLEAFNFNKYFDGNMGQDILMQFNTLIINFEEMFIDFE